MKGKFDRIVVGMCLAVLAFFACTIAIRFLTRQVLIERLGMDNAFTRVVWFDNVQARTRETDDAETDERMRGIAGGASGSAGHTADVQETVADISWEERFPFTGQTDEAEGEAGMLGQAMSFAERFSGKAFFIEERIETYTADLLIGYYQWVTLAEEYNDLIGWTQVESLSSTDNDDILYLDNGYLTYAQPLIENDEIARIAGRVAGFKDFLDARGIDFYYINAGSKVCPYDKQLSRTASEFTNENGDRLMEALREQKLDAVDMREYMRKDGLDWYDSYYITDHHWKTQTGLWAAGVVGRLLNEKSGFEFDDFYFADTSYRFETFENYFFGNQGRAVTFAGADPEDYTKITPLFSTDFSVEIPSKGVDARGTYDEVLFSEDDFLKIAEYTKQDFLTEKDAYHCAGITNEALTTIKNNCAEHNRDKKILMLQDSFSWYLTSYLACDIGEIDVIYPASFTGSIRDYIRQTKPDVVIMMLCERNILPIDAAQEAGHTAMFELK